jgi:hypothetical protein
VPLLSLALLLLILGSSAPARADDPPRPGDWTVVGDEATDREAWQPGLWLPMRDGPDPMVGDILGRHAAMYPVASPRCVLTLSRLVKGDLSDAPVIRYRDATLEPEGGAALRPIDGDAWRGQAAGQRSIASRDGPGMTDVTIPFPALDPAVSALTLRVPVVDGVTIVVRFARWRELLAAAELELAAWKEHIEASRERNAIGPYLDCDGFRALRARGDQLVAALLLRELARGEEQHDATAVPRFLVLHVLADTAWGRTQLVPASGDGATARKVLALWRDSGLPQVPGISPRGR